MGSSLTEPLQHGSIAISVGADPASTTEWLLSNVQVTSGVRRLRIPNRIDTLYDNGIFIPIEDWRALTEEEARGCAVAWPDSSHNWLLVLRARTMLSELLAGLGLHHILEPTSWNGVASSSELDVLQAEVSKHLKSWGFHANEFVLQVRRGGLPSTTYDDSAKTLIGLHVDNQGHHAIPERGRARPRLLLNIGREPRSFVCLPKTLTRLMQELQIPQTEQGVERYLYTYRLVHDYLERFPKAQIWRLRMEPGVGLIAPVQNMMHDGYTVGIRSMDIVLTTLLDPA